MFSLIRNERGNWTLVGLLVAVAIGFLLYFMVLMPKLNSADRAAKEGLIEPKPGQSVVGASMDKAKETECASNLRQTRMMIDSHKATNEAVPASLSDLRLGSIVNCPVSNQAYEYDAATGTVKCPTPGHEKL